MEVNYTFVAYLRITGKEVVLFELPVKITKRPVRPPNLIKNSEMCMDYLIPGTLGFPGFCLAFELEIAMRIQIKTHLPVRRDNCRMLWCA